MSKVTQNEAQALTLERLDAKLDEVETLIIELGLSKNQQGVLQWMIDDMWKDIKKNVDIEQRCRAYEQRIGADDLINQISDTLCEVDADFLCEVANKVLAARHSVAGSDEHGYDLILQENADV